jgi:MSHA biogenesis protein MshJ
MNGRFRIELRKLMDRIDEMSLRERALIFLGVLATMYVTATQLVIYPLAAQRARLEQDLRQKHSQTQAAERQIQAIVTGESLDADVTKRARLDGLRAQLKSIETNLGNATSGLVTPKEMARLVEQFLANMRGLEVVKVESLPPELLLGEGAKAPIIGTAAVQGAALNPGGLVYKHGLKIELRGPYLNMLTYLNGLEALPWKVFWGQVSLHADTYPVSRLTVVIYTLSTREGWIGI